MRSVIMFHGIQEDPSPLTVSKEEFTGILSAIRDNGFAIKPLKEVLAADPNDDVVAVTFEDGFKSVNEAAEIMAGMGVTATVFVVTGYVGKTNRWPGQIEGTAMQRLLNWDELRELRSAGWDLQAHSHSHPDLRQLPDAHVIKELDRCVATMTEQLGEAPRTFAYPYGYLNRRVYEHVQARFDYGLTGMLSALPDHGDPHLVPRLDAAYLWPKPVHFYFGRRRFWAYLQARQQVRRWQSNPVEPPLDEILGE